MAPSVASRLNTAFGEDEINESDTRTAGFDAMSVSGDAGLASGESDSLAALAGGPARGGSAPRDEPVRTLTIVGVALRISPRRDEKIPCNNDVLVTNEMQVCHVMLGCASTNKPFYLNQIIYRIAPLREKCKCCTSRFRPPSRAIGLFAFQPCKPLINQLLSPKTRSTWGLGVVK